MALAIKFQDMVDRGEVRDYADLARLGFVTRARLTQIMNLLLLAPDIQELLLNPSSYGVLTERDLRHVIRHVRWGDQRQALTSDRNLLLPAGTMAITSARLRRSSSSRPTRKN
jgi:hypothetical protein